MSSQNSWYYEGKVASKLGVSREDMKYVRDQILKKNKDWRVPGRELILSQAGLSAILKFWANSNGADFTAVDFTDCIVPGEQKKAGGGLELIVKKLCLNRRLLVATLPDSKEDVRVQVPDNVNFRPKMAIKVRPPLPLPAPQLYRLEGRCPRYPGRW